MKSLKEYVRKRDFRKTREPAGKVEKGNGNRRFVIQKHAARQLHYDFRLEMGGTLKSWALPKGLPFAKGEKHLAVQVEDHPISYINFEGTIPKGQYGGGTVMVWDAGTFTTTTPTPLRDVESGKLHFELNGHKLHGLWHLVRLRGGKQWLLIRGGKSMRPVSRKKDDTSALSGKSMKQLSRSDEVWPPKPANARGLPAKRVHQKKTRSEGRAVKFIDPMKARLVNSPPAGEWLYEVKFDGFRGIALKDRSEVRLLSRNEKKLGTKFPEIAEAVAELEADQAIIDGEIVALDSKGRSSFQLLQAYELGEMRPPIFYYVFDLLHLDGQDLREQPLIRRKERLEQLLGNSAGVIRYSASLGGDAQCLLKKMRRLRLEGLIGKRRDSVYEAGRRSGAWIKLKLVSESEFVIGGYTNPSGSRQHFGALLTGYHQSGKLLFAGKVGTGFTEARLCKLHEKFAKLGTSVCPFANLPEKRGSRHSPRMTPAEMRRCHWLKPRLVCQIQFSEWTREGKLRQPVFLGLREDKEAGEVVRERAA